MKQSKRKKNRHLSPQHQFSFSHLPPPTFWVVIWVSTTRLSLRLPTGCGCLIVSLFPFCSWSFVCLMLPARSDNRVYNKDLWKACCWFHLVLLLFFFLVKVHTAQEHVSLALVWSVWSSVCKQSTLMQMCDFNLSVSKVWACLAVIILLNPAAFSSFVKLLSWKTSNLQLICDILIIWDLNQFCISGFFALDC